MTDEKAELLEQLLIWWHRLHKTSNKKFFPLFWNRSRYLVLMGGGGSGQSIFAGRKILERAISEPEHRFGNLTKQRMKNPKLKSISR